MNLHLAEIATAVAPGCHAVLLLDQAGWHLSHQLAIPGVTTRFVQNRYAKRTGGAGARSSRDGGCKPAASKLSRRLDATGNQEFYQIVTGPPLSVRDCLNCAGADLPAALWRTPFLL